MQLRLAFILCFFVTTAAVAHASPQGIERAPRFFRKAVEQVLPAVVTIETYGTTTMEVNPKRKRAIQGFSQPGEGPTSGLVISPDGHILTSTYNFLRKPKIITVVLHDGRRKVATLLGKDETRQLALLKIDADSLPMPVLAERDQLRVGQWAVSVGVGYGGTQPSVSVGILSALHRISGKAVQTDANTSPANYGGPLIDIRGRVIGLITPLSPRAGSELAAAQWYDSGIGFAVPLDGLDSLIERMKKGETIERGMMGVSLEKKPEKAGGLKISKIAKHSPAEIAGLKKGDIITHIFQTELVDMVALKTEIGRYHAGDTVTLTYTRDDQTHTADLILQTPPFKKPETETETETEPEKPDTEPEEPKAESEESEAHPEKPEAEPEKESKPEAKPEFE